MRTLTLMLSLVFATLCMAAELPCILTQIDGSLFPSGGKVAIYATSGMTNCPEVPVMELNEDFGIYNLLRLIVNRWNSLTGEWQQVHEQLVFKIPAGVYSRVLVSELTDLADGRYRLITTNGSYFLEAIHFTLGGTEENPFSSFGITPHFDPERRTPHIRSSRVVKEGYLYFRGSLGGPIASGYLYQLRPKRIEVLPVVFEQVTTLIDQPFGYGSFLDLPWIRVKLPNNSFESNRPVYASITTDGGGITIQGVVFDPTDPLVYYTGGFGVGR